MDHGDLEALLDRELKALPLPQAPPTLVPRVLAAAAAPPMPAATGWFTWPLAWRAASAAGVLVLALAAWWVVTSPPATIGGAARTAVETATLLRVFWDVLLEPFATYIFVLGVLLTLACAAAWAAFEFALGGASHQ